MSARRHCAAPALLAAAGLLLSGCIDVPDYQPAGFVTPKDPPALPARKPPPPALAAGWGSPVMTAAGALPEADLPGVAPAVAPAAAAVEVQELPPQAIAPSQRAAARQVAAAVRPAVAEPAAAAPGGRYVVAHGDSLYGIARRFGLPVRTVIDANDMKPPYALSIGQELKIPRAQVHEVVPGDTVFSIAQRYNVDRSELVRLNGIAPPYTIPVGEKLILPPPDSAAQVAPAATAVAYTPPDQPAATVRTAPVVARSVIAKPAPKPRSREAVRTALAHPPARAGSRFHWPVHGPVLSAFGAKAGGEHNDGINIAAPRGTAVRAAENGVVAYAGDELKGFGKLLLIKHAGGWVTAYAHNEDLLVSAGDVVRQGQTIARVGSSGHVQRPQLHFEVRRGTRAVDPVTQLAPRTASAVD